MKKDIIIATALAMLLFMCIFVIMLDINETFNIITYEQKHKVFVPDTMPKELSPDSIKPIKSYRNGSIIYN